ncbi:LacI family DNA-binding transcriptional regulator [Rhizobium sp. GR12]|uniref:LacI family DNA-binding transcriptional regulator n=1 Tax=Rhizobium sp. GR12 TaxID=3053925 RepID=UPI002FBDA015
MTLNDADPVLTLKDIATEAGLSVAAVSKVLNNRGGVSQASRDRILQIMDQIGYKGRGGRLNAAPSREATVLTLGRYAQNDGFYGEILAGIVEAGAREGVVIDVKVVSDSDCDLPPEQLFSGAMPKAVLLLGVDGPPLIDSISRMGIPAVLINGMDRSMRLSSIAPDYHFGGWMATRHLLDLGHREILHVTHPYRESIRRRIDGFRNALEEADIAFDAERHILDLGTPMMLGIDARELVAKYLAKIKRPPTAMVCINDIVAIAAIQAVQAHGLSVPRDISVVGFDDLPVGAHSAPQLTTMRVDRRELGRIAVGLLQHEGETQSVQRVSLGATLVQRGSTGAPREHD